MSLQDLLADELVTRITSNKVHCNVCDKDMSSYGTYQHFARHWRDCLVEEVDRRFRRLVVDYGDGYRQLEDEEPIRADDEHLVLEETTRPFVQSWCPSCKRLLLGGEHFEGRACGTCHSITKPSQQGETTDRILVWKPVADVCRKSVVGRPPSYYGCAHRFRRRV